MKKNEKNERKRKRTIFGRKNQPPPPASCGQKYPLSKSHQPWKTRGLIKYHGKIERNTLYLLVKKEIFIDLGFME
jgi:hypothetical protein